MFFLLNFFLVVFERQSLNTVNRKIESTAIAEEKSIGPTFLWSKSIMCEGVLQEMVTAYTKLRSNTPFKNKRLNDNNNNRKLTPVINTDMN